MGQRLPWWNKIHRASVEVDVWERSNLAMRIKTFQAFALLSLLWVAGCGGTRAADPASLHVYIGAADGTISALDAADGAVRWRYQAACACPADVQALADGVVYASIPDGSSAATSLYALNAADGAVRWQMKTPGAGAFGVVSKGVAYITASAPSDDPAQHNEVQARRASDGSLLWRRQMEGTGPLAARMVGDTLYLASFDSHRDYFGEHLWTALYALDSKDGSVRWHKSLGASNYLLAAANGHLYLDEDVTDIVCGSNVGALDASTGQDRWAFPKEWPDCASLIGTENDLVYGLVTRRDTPTAQSSLYALKANDGSKAWQVDLPFSADTGLLAKGAIYVSSADALAAFSARDGSALWRAQGEGGQRAFFNGLLYTSLWGHSLDALNPASGAVEWRFTSTDDITPTTSANGVLYGVSSYRVTDAVWHQDVVAFDAKTGKLLWRFHLGAGRDVPIVG
jgi:outer membrane protein assembly factor BamB